MTKLSALIVAHNEEARLGACLDGLAFADEIVVVLDRCTDGSKAIAEAAGARTVEGAWPLEGPRREAGVAAAAGPWILEVDADETVPPALAGEIRAAVDADETDFHFMPMKNRVGGRWVKGGWMAALAPDLKGSLFRKGAKTWGRQRVHPGTDFAGRRGADFRNAIEHDYAPDLSGLVKRFNRNTSLHAEDMAESWAQGPVPGKNATLVRKAFSRFWKCYVSRGGRKEGAAGLTVAILCALYPLVSKLKADEIRSRPENR